MSALSGSTGGPTDPPVLLSAAPDAGTATPTLHPIDLLTSAGATLTDGSSSATLPVTDALSTAGTPSAFDAVTGATTSLADGLVQSPAPIVPVADASGHLFEAAGAVAPALESVPPTASAVTGALAQVVDTTPAGPLTADGPVAGALSAVGAVPVVEPVSSAVAPVVDGVGYSAGSVLDAVPNAGVPLGETGAPLLDPVSSAASPGAILGPVAGDLPVAGPPFLDATAVASSSVVDTTRDAGATLLEMPAPLGGAGATVPDGVLGSGDAIGSVAATVGPSPIDIPSVALGGAADQAASAGVATGAADVVPAFGSLGGSRPSLDPIAEVLGDAASNPGVILTVGVATLVGLTAVGRGSGLGGCAAGAQLVFTNVRLMPCVAVESVANSVSQVGSTVSRLSGRALPVTRAATPGGAAAGGVGGRPVDAEPARSPVAAVGGQLMARLGIALAALYAAFLTVWLAATRLRSDARA